MINVLAVHVRKLFIIWCSPELVQNEPYTEKVDVWAAGCLLYQMAMLCYPFHSPNLLKLAQQVTPSPLSIT